jgi:DNA polymerase III delta prime subunit
LEDQVRLLLDPFSVAEVAPGSFRFSINPGEPPLEDFGLRTVEVHRFPDGREIRHYASETRRVSHVLGMAWHQVDLERQEAEIIIQPGREWCLEAASLTPILCDLFGRNGCHAFHAATLVASTRNGPRALMIAGVSGAGKTTTALALARSGFHLATDDASFLLRRDGGLKVFGFPRPLKVHRKTLAMMDWIGKLEPDPQWRQDEFLLYLDRLAPVVPGAEFQPALLVLLQHRNDRDHRIEPWDPLDAMSEMTRQNVRSAGGMALESAGGCFNVIGDLVTGCRTIRLSAGPDLSSIAGVLSRELED